LSLETKSRKHPGKKGLVKISTAWSTMEIEWNWIIPQFEWLDFILYNETLFI
jgi:hypothetical protein